MITQARGLLNTGGHQVVFEELEKDNVLHGNVLTVHDLVAVLTDSAVASLLPPSLPARLRFRQIALHSIALSCLEVRPTANEWQQPDLRPASTNQIGEICKVGHLRPQLLLKIFLPSQNQ